MLKNDAYDRMMKSVSSKKMWNLRSAKKRIKAMKQSNMVGTNCRGPFLSKPWRRDKAYLNLTTLASNHVCLSSAFKSDIDSMCKAYSYDLPRFMFEIFLIF